MADRAPIFPRCHETRSCAARLYAAAMLVAAVFLLLPVSCHAQAPVQDSALTEQSPAADEEAGRIVPTRTVQPSIRTWIP